MPAYFIKNCTCSFDHSTQPEGFASIIGIENKFFLTNCPTTPTGEFVAEFPQPLFENYAYVLWENGAKTMADPFQGQVTLSEETDKRNRRVITYTEDQLAIRLEIFRWIAVNLFVPDKEQITGNTAATITHLAEIALISKDTDMRQYIIDNLYYDL